MHLPLRTSARRRSRRRRSFLFQPPSIRKVSRLPSLLSKETSHRRGTFKFWSVLTVILGKAVIWRLIFQSGDRSHRCLCFISRTSAAMSRIPLILANLNPLDLLMDCNCLSFKSSNCLSQVFMSLGKFKKLSSSSSNSVIHHYCFQLMCMNDWLSRTLSTNRTECVFGRVSIRRTKTMIIADHHFSFESFLMSLAEEAFQLTCKFIIVLQVRREHRSWFQEAGKSLKTLLESHK